jgi:hypothetical protein
MESCGGFQWQEKEAPLSEDAEIAGKADAKIANAGRTPRRHVFVATCLFAVRIAARGTFWD